MKQEKRTAVRGGRLTVGTMALLAAGSFLSVQAMGQDLYWTGAKNEKWFNAGGQTNWSTNPAFTDFLAFTMNANVIFSQTPITAGNSLADINGVTAASISLTHTSGSYNFIGSTLNGTSLTLNGGGNLTLNNSATILSGAVAVSGGSEMTLTGTLSAGSISATGTFTQGSGTTQGNTNASGTIILAAPNRISDTAAITLGGGTLRTGGFDEGTSSTAGLGTLTLTADSILDFTSTGGLLHFSGFSPGTSTLQIWNWDSSDQLYFSPQINETQLAQIVFYSDNGLTSLGQGAIGIGGVIVPVPEPGTIFGAVALLGLISWRERRRIGVVLQSLR